MRFIDDINFQISSFKAGTKVILRDGREFYINKIEILFGECYFTAIGKGKNSLFPLSWVTEIRENETLDFFEKDTVIFVKESELLWQVIVSDKICTLMKRIDTEEIIPFETTNLIRYFRNGLIELR